MNTYCNLAFAYGLVRSAYVMHGAHLNVYNYESKLFETRPILVTERLTGVVLGTCLTFCLAPIVIASDLNKVEMVLRNRYHKEKKQTTSTSVYTHILSSI